MNYQLDCVNLVYDAEKDGGTAALRDVTLSLDGKGLIGIQGPSGSGSCTRWQDLKALLRGECYTAIWI